MPRLLDVFLFPRGLMLVSLNVRCTFQRGQCAFFRPRVWLRPRSYCPRDGMSWVTGDASQPLLNMTIGDHFRGVVASHGDREALVVVDQQLRLTYAQLGDQVDMVAAALLDLGMVKGDRLGVWMPNNSEWLVMQMATARVGVILVNINPQYQAPELEYALNAVQVKALVTVPTSGNSSYLDTLAALCPELHTATPSTLHAAAVPSLRVVISTGPTSLKGVLPYQDLLAAPSPQALQRLETHAAALTPLDPINIQFTSGTTGRPKGATLTHYGILNNGYFVGEKLRYTREDRVCIPVPLYHCFGMVLGNLACLTHGAAMVYPQAQFDPRATLAAVEAERCSSLYGVPTMFIAQLDHPEFDRFDLSSLRTGIMAGSNCPIDTMRQVLRKMHMAEVSICYGMTETSPVSFQTDIDDPPELRCETVGRIHPHVECRVVDDKGNTVLRGEVGELLTRGYVVMQGYWGDEQQTARAIDDEGWMHTGDLASIDAEGYCRIVGRLKDVIIRGGENIYPREIEDELFLHPAVLNVSVIGVPDSRYGEEVCAWVHRKQDVTAVELQDYCRRRLARFKCPKYWIFDEEFPLTVTGKIQKFVMRNITVKKLGLGPGQ